MKVLQVEQNTDEWRTLRRSKVGASDISILMTGTDKEIYDLYWEKKGHDKYQTSAMRRGSQMEDEARRWFQTQTDISFERPVGLHDEYDWLLASFDGLNFDLGVSLEIKCPNEVPSCLETWKSWKRYWWQVQAQLAVGGHEKSFLLAYSGPKQVYTMIHRDEDAIVDLIGKGKSFYELVQSDTPPSYVETRQDKEAEEFAEAAKLLKSQIDDLDEQWKILREGGIYLANETSFECEGVRLLKIPPKTTVDYKAALIALCPEADLTAFQKRSTSSWRLTV